VFGDEPPTLGGTGLSYSLIASSHDFLLSTLLGRNRHMQQTLPTTQRRRRSGKVPKEPSHILRGNDDAPMMAFWHQVSSFFFVGTLLRIGVSATSIPSLAITTEAQESLGL
jgi:hypothetical protein